MSIHGFMDQNGQIQKYDYNDLENKPTIPAEVLIDDTLAEQGQAADAKAVGDAINDIEPGLSSAAKQALLEIFQHVGYIDDDGSLYYDVLYDALYPPADLVSISAVYTQPGIVYDTDSLESLKADLVVTALYTNSSTAVVTRYMLSGTLEAGASVIEVYYGGKSTSFTVTVTHDDSGEWDYIWRYEDGLPPVSDWAWTVGGGQGQVHTIVDGGLKMGAKAGTNATYTMSYGAYNIASAGGGIAEFTFYLPFVQTGAITDNYYFRVAISDGTNTLAVKLTHPRNSNNANNIYLHTAGTDWYVSPDLLRSFSANELLIVRFEMDSVNVTGKVYINGVLEADNVDLTTISSAGTSVSMYVGGFSYVPPDSSAVYAEGAIIKSVKLKYGLDEVTE